MAQFAGEKDKYEWRRKDGLVRRRGFTRTSEGSSPDPRTNLTRKENEMKHNHVWVVEMLNKKGEWVPTDLSELDKASSRACCTIQRRRAPHIKFRPKKYTAPRGYA